MKYPEKESATIEFKQQLPSGQQIAKTLVAFCNLFGGKIIIGVDDDGIICGIDEKDIGSRIESLQQSIYQSCTPTILPLIYTQRIFGKLLLIIEVSSGMNKPYFVSALGLNEGTFIRAGAHTTKATASMIQELSWKGRGFFVDEMPIYSSTISDIDKEGFINFLKDHRSQYKKSETDDQLMHYKIIVQEHKKAYPTLGGILLFGSDPQKFFPESFIICTHFQGVSGRKAIATKDCVGNLFLQLTSAINFVLSRLNQQFEITSVKRKQQYEIPEIALREIIINAIVHRDYLSPGPIKIAIYDDRVEIFSPGGFPGPLNVNQLEMGITYIRNHVICKIFRESGYIEKLGSGFLTLFKSYEEYKLPRPQVIEGTGFIKCILPRSTHSQNNVYEPNSIEQNIMKLFYLSDEITVRDIVKNLQISRQTAARRLSELVKAGKLERRGKGPSTYYKRKI